MSPVLCKLCIVARGATIEDALDGDDELLDHIELVHDIPVRREGETDQEATARVLAKNPRMGGPDCHCPTCPWARGQQRAAAGGAGGW